MPLCELNLLLVLFVCIDPKQFTPLLVERFYCFLVIFFDMNIFFVDSLLRRNSLFSV